MELEKAIFQRTELLLGKSFIASAAKKKIIIFGIGGVGSWCAESLVRSGIKELTIVDFDTVCASNVNRQLVATTKTVGIAKTDVLKERLLEINPAAQITALQKVYDPGTDESFGLGSYDFIIDAIDSLSNKAYLIQQATKTGAQLFSSMGAALKMDPSRVRVAEFWAVKGCPLGAALRRKIRKSGGVSKKFMCVYSDELLTNRGEDPPFDTDECTSRDASHDPGDPDLTNPERCSPKAVINGTTSYMPAIFGMTIAGLVVQYIEREARSLEEAH